MTRHDLKVLGAGATGLALALFAGDASATNCSSLPGSVLYGSGGSAQLPLLTQVGTQLANLTPAISLVYSDTGSACAGYSDLVTPTPITGSAYYWDGSGESLTCQLDLAGDPVTLAVMGNAPDLCPGFGDAGTGDAGSGDTFKQFLGPVQPVDFVVPVMSDQQSISTEAAYYIWGFGAATPSESVSPWATTANIFTRSSSSFVALFVALDTGVPVATVAAHGTSETSNSNTVSALNELNANGTYESGIGFVSGEVADENRSEIRVLAYQHTGQSCGYWPDSTPNALDKVNVRSGQYWLWSPVHLFAAVDSSGQVVDATTAAVIGYLTGTVTPPSGFDVFGAELAAYTVPQCAMEAWRDGDLAPPYSYQPPASCSCKFDYATHNTDKPATCTTCTTDQACTTQHCRNIGPPLDADGGADVGYCEVN
jgi:hypothetical protein